MDFSSYIEHTMLAPDATEDKIIKLCIEAKQWHFKAVCVNSCYVPLCAEELRNSEVLVGCVIGFPLGSMSTEAKEAETEYVISHGADEVDMVINIGYLKDKKEKTVIEDIYRVKKACKNKLLKVIIETCLLSEEEKIRACELVKKSGADFIKTSTGFSKYGATIEDIKLMRSVVGKEFGIKAAGGIRNYDKAIELIRAGADRLGCSASVKIMQEYLEQKNK